MKTISLWQPWCFAVTHLGKNIENRVWQTRHRGPLLLHAAKRRPTKAESRDGSRCVQVLRASGDVAGSPGWDALLPAC